MVKRWMCVCVFRMERARGETEDLRVNKGIIWRRNGKKRGNYKRRLDSKRGEIEWGLT